MIRVAAATVSVSETPEPAESMAMAAEAATVVVEVAEAVDMAAGNIPLRAYDEMIEGRTGRGGIQCSPRT